MKYLQHIKDIFVISGIKKIEGKNKKSNQIHLNFFILLYKTS